MNVTVNFASAPDALVGSTYKIETSTNASSWSVLAAAQPATQIAGSYVSPATVLAEPCDFGALTINLSDATKFSSSGSGYLDGEAYISWTGKTGNQLTGVTWNSGYGSYTSDSPLVQAHESYVDSNVTTTLGAIWYRITHINSNGVASAPAYLTVLVPPLPSSALMCVVVISAFKDVTWAPRVGVSVTAQIEGSDQFVNSSGDHLGRGTGPTDIVTNAFGLAFVECYITNRLVTKGGGSPKGYTFNVGGEVMKASVIPDQPWVLLEDILDA